MNIVDRVKHLVHEGNKRRVVVTRDERTVAAFPLTAGVVGAVVAPALAAAGAIVALLTRCTITVERTDEREASFSPPSPVEG
jgi:hypothetical protein